jgi:hypothetical protein
MPLKVVYCKNEKMHDDIGNIFQSDLVVRMWRNKGAEYDFEHYVPSKIETNRNRKELTWK